MQKEASRSLSPSVPDPASVQGAGAGAAHAQLTVEERVRKERPPARVRFAESSQPDFAMMELEKVSVVFGNAEVMRDASFDVKTGERVGLVGPNGGGKTTLLKVLSGEIEPTSGDVVKSSRYPILLLVFSLQYFCVSF